MSRRTPRGTRPARHLAAGLLVGLFADPLGAVALAASPAAPPAGDAAIGFTTYLREGPGTRYAPLDQAVTGARVDVVACRDGWCRIRYGDATGYVAQGALEMSAPAAATSTGAAPRCYLNVEAGRREGRDVAFCYADGPLR